MGPSGSGKSTLLHIIAGIDRPTSGECRVQDVDVTGLNESKLADWRNQNVGFVFQTFNLIPVLIRPHASTHGYQINSIGDHRGLLLDRLKRPAKAAACVATT